MQYEMLLARTVRKHKITKFRPDLIERLGC